MSHGASKWRKIGVARTGSKQSGSGKNKTRRRAVGRPTDSWSPATSKSRRVPPSTNQSQEEETQRLKKAVSRKKMVASLRKGQLGHQMAKIEVAILGASAAIAGTKRVKVRQSLR